VKLLPLGLGIQALSGFRISCLKTHRSTDIDNLHFVLVEKRPQEDETAPAQKNASEDWPGLKEMKERRERREKEKEKREEREEREDSQIVH